MSEGIRSETEEVVGVRTLPILWTTSKILNFVFRVPGRHRKFQSRMTGLHSSFLLERGFMSRKSLWGWRT